MLRLRQIELLHRSWHHYYALVLLVQIQFDLTDSGIIFGDARSIIDKTSCVVFCSRPELIKWHT